MSKTYRTCLLLIILIVTSYAIITPVKAQPRTITVPENYPTISSAIEHAQNNDIIYVKAGNYSENSLSINKSITLIGENKDSTTISLDSPSHEETVSIIFHYIWYDSALRVTSDGFKLSGFTITTTGGNIIIDGNRTKITANTIGADMSLNGSNIQLSNNRLTSQVSLNGVSATGQFCNISSNQITGGLYVNGNNHIIASNDVSGSLGVSANSSLIRANRFHDSSDSIIISGNYNLISGNSIDRYGLGPEITGTSNNFFLNNVTRCGVAISPGSGNIFYANYFSKNAWILEGAYQNSSESVFFYNNFVDNYNYKIGSSQKSICLIDDGTKGNYWSDYIGRDANGDSIGDTPYTLDLNHVDHYPLVSPFNFSSIPEAIPDIFIEPNITLTNPQSTEYAIDYLPILVTTDDHAVGYYYSIDNQHPLTFTGNTTITGLNEGQHNITAYAMDNFGNLVSSQTINFTIQESPPFALDVITAITVLVIFAVIVLYIKKRRKSLGTYMPCFRRL
jgi:nitrous oxidase accessory protein NosD